MAPRDASVRAAVAGVAATRRASAFMVALCAISRKSDPSLSASALRTIN
jgi:hypothetical protein